MKLSGRTVSPVLLAAFFTSSAWSANTTHDVVVVGAGSAGLYAAKTLINDGYDVLLIEATDRIGGRVFSHTLGSTRIDLGAEEHYLATGSNPVWPAINGEYGSAIYVEGYQGLDAYSMDGGTTTCWTSASAQYTCEDDPDYDLIDEFWSWYWRPNWHQNANSTVADDVMDEFGVGAGHRAYHLLDSNIAGGSYATSLDKLGARSLAIQDNDWDLSEDIRVIGDKDLGYSDALATVWWNDVLANSDLLLNSPVVGIDTSGSDVVVTDANGDMHAARQVIVTVSIGVLQSEMIDFTPDLPAETVDAYNGIGIDKGMKVPMRFSSPWWETQGEEMGWLVTEGLAGACWAPTNYKIGTTDNILMCYPMGENGVALNDIAAAAGGGASGDAAIIAAVLADLDVTFPEAPGEASANYLEGVVQNWGTHPYTLGVYSYPKVGTFQTAENNKRADLQVPVAGNRIYFAGEGSHITHPATVVGALHEGERAAAEVVSVNGTPNNPPPLPGGGGEYTEISFDDFENGFGSWLDGGQDAKLYTGGKWATGSNAINLQREGDDATMTTANLALAGMTEVKVNFEYVPKGLDNNEYFQLQLSTDGGNSFQVVQQWTRNVDFNDKEYHSELVTINGISLTDQTQLRFRNFADLARDNVYIDEVRVSAK
jgi:monoamine oxidase